MNIPQPVLYCLLGIVIVLSITPIQQLTNKTIQRIKRKKRLKEQTLQILNEVTHRVQTEFFSQQKNEVGVAKGLASPNVLEGVRYNGDTISFIVCQENLVVFITAEKKFRIWYNKGWYFHDQQTGSIFALHGKMFWAASKLSRIARKKHFQCVVHRIKLKKRDFDLETACNS